MLKKPAVLLVEYQDGRTETTAGEKAEIYGLARELCRTINDTENPDKVARVLAVGAAGVLKDKKWKTTVSEDPASDEEDGEADASALRAALKEKGVRVPPRISLEKLVELAAENGIEA